MISSVSYKPQHLELLALPISGEQQDALQARSMGLLENQSTATRTVFNNGRVISIVGLIPLNAGVAEVWTVPSERIKEVPLGYTRYVKALISAYSTFMNLHRLQMSVEEGFEMGLRWAKLLGFEVEGLMKKYGPDQKNHLLMGRAHG